MSRPAHCFVVPAYGQSPYLAECLASLNAQSLKSRIVVSTSTPYAGLDRLCDAAGAELVVHGPNRGIANDWNAALRAASSDWVTIAHQDDLYLPEFTQRTLAAVARWPDAMLVFCDYEEIVGDTVRPRSAALRIKRALVELGMMGRRRVAGRWRKTNVLRFGCSIGCPTVTLRLSDLPLGGLFDERYRVNLDWDMWLRLAQHPAGAFVRDRAVLVRHRIHAGSETTAGIADGVRPSEDLELFRRMWPDPCARALARLYARSYRYNEA